MRPLSFALTIFASTVLSQSPSSDVGAPLDKGSLHRREIRAHTPSGLDITAYTGFYCRGAGVPFPNVQYSYDYPGQIHSYSLSRDLNPGEQLDFSTFSVVKGISNPACGAYLASAPNEVVKGCYQLDVTATSRGRITKGCINGISDVAILHEIITTASQSPNVDDLPFRAVFAAYDQVLAQHGLDPDHDQVLLRFLFRLGTKRGRGQSLFDAFEALLADLGIQILFGSEKELSQEVITGKGVSENVPVPDVFEARVGRSRRASFSSFYDGEDESTRALRQRGSSRASLSQLHIVRPSTRATTRPTERVRSHNAQLPSALASPARGGLTSKEFDSNLLHYQRRRASISSQDGPHISSRGSNEQNQHRQFTYSYPASENVGQQRPATPEDTISSDISHDVDISRPFLSNAQIHRLSETHLLRDANTLLQFRTQDVAQKAIRKWQSLAIRAYHRHYEMEQQATLYDVKILIRQAYDQWRVLFLGRKQVVETERFFNQLERRASKARDLYLLTKAFTHWAQCAYEEVERNSVARRHILRTRYFSAWLEITAVNNLKVRRQGLKKFFFVWRQSFRSKITDSSIAVTFYYQNLVETIYWRWFWNFCERRAPEWRNVKLRRRSFVKLVSAKQSRSAVEVQAVGSYEDSLKKGYFTSWQQKIRKVLSDHQQAEQIHQHKVQNQYLSAWQLQLRYAPLTRRIVGMVNWRIASSAFSMVVVNFRLERQAEQINRGRILRASWTQWNDRLRWQTLSRQIDDRLMVQFLYKWVLAERFILLQRLSQERLKQNDFRKLAEHWRLRRAQLDKRCRAMIFSRNQVLLRSLVQRWHGHLLIQNQRKEIAFQFHAPRIAQDTLESWKVNYGHLQKLQTWAEKSAFYFRAWRTFRRLQTAVVESQKEKRRNAYASVRRRVKMNLARRLLIQWNQRTVFVLDLHKTVLEIDQQKIVRLGTALFDRWRDRLSFSVSENVEASQNFNADLAQQQLQIWVERSRTAKEAEAKATDFAISHVQKVAYESLRALQLKVFEYRSHTQTAADLQAWNEKRHYRSFLRIWREESSRRRGVIGTDFARSYRSRKTGIRPVAENSEGPTGTDTAALDDGFEIGDWIPSPEAQNRLTPMAGYLSTPSKRAARARALIRGPTTPATPLNLRTPMLRRLHTQSAVASRLGRGGETRFTGFNDIVEERPKTPGTR
ncbi:hypothetical protein MMC18_003270 [Xylographa bjoerkii]|nr:hypothetical protein [Xylographa bjoerkii]